jgi:hypothetical protein
MLSSSLPPNEESPSHQKVLRSLKGLQLPSYEIMVEETTNRLDLPNEFFQLGRKGKAQRKRSLCYTDAIVHANRSLSSTVANLPPRSPTTSISWRHRKSFPIEG